MKKPTKRIAFIIAIIITFSLIVPLNAEAALVGETEISSQAAIVLDCETGVVLYTYNPDALRVPASLTKLLAVYVIYDAARAGEIKLDSATKISRSASEFSRNLEYSNVPLTEGASIELNKLLEVVLIRSACAATVALGEALCGSEAAFVARMNQKAALLGIEGRFYDCYGGSPDNRISARGLAVLSRTLINDFPEILKISSKKNVTFNGVTYNSSNLLLGQYTGLDGLKTGYTVPAGYCFVGTALRAGRRIIAVTMGSTLESRYPDTRALLDYGFAVADRIIAEYNSAIGGTAVPSTANLVVNGVTAPLIAYVIDDLHYFKLRDIAFLLSGTQKQFEVTWNSADKTAGIKSGFPYTIIGGEMSAAAAGPRQYIPTTSKIYYNNEARSLEVYLIDNSNYFKLRDLADLIGFEVDWIQETHTVIINAQPVNDDNSNAPQIEPLQGDLVGLFFDVITDLLGTDLFIDTSIEILAFDLMDLYILSPAEKNTLLRTIRDAYGFNTIQAAIDELYEQGYIGTSNVYFQKGLLFTFTNLDVISDSEFVFSVSIWRGSRSTNFFVDYSAKKSGNGIWSFTSNLDATD